MANISENISEVFDLEQEEPVEIEAELLEEPSEVPQKVLSTDAKIQQYENDFADVRKDIRQLLNDTQTALDSANALAVESESARAYEVVAQLIERKMELIKQLLEIHTTKLKHEQMRDGKGSSEDSKSTTITNTAIFTGTSKDLNEYFSKLLKDIK